MGLGEVTWYKRWNLDHPVPGWFPYSPACWSQVSASAEMPLCCLSGLLRPQRKHRSEELGFGDPMASLELGVWGKITDRGIHASTDSSMAPFLYSHKHPYPRFPILWSHWEPTGIPLARVLSAPLFIAGSALKASLPWLLLSFVKLFALPHISKTYTNKNPLFSSLAWHSPQAIPGAILWPRDIWSPWILPEMDICP